MAGRSGPWPGGRARGARRAGMAAATTRGGSSSIHRSASAGPGHRGCRDALRFRRGCARRSTSRSADRNAARRSRVSRPRWSPPRREISPPRRRAPHDACGSRGSDRCPPGRGVPSPRSGRRRTDTRPCIAPSRVSLGSNGWHGYNEARRQGNRPRRADRQAPDGHQARVTLQLHLRTRRIRVRGGALSLRGRPQTIKVRGGGSPMPV